MAKHIFPRPPFSALFALFFAVLVGFSSACSSKIGDECESVQDCPIEQGAICDTTVEGGYCLVQGCEVGSCPANSDCVVFDRNTRFCMMLCNSNDDCRSGLVCRRDYNFANTSVGYCYAPAGAPPREYPQYPVADRDTSSEMDASDAAADTSGTDTTDEADTTGNLDTTDEPDTTNNLDTTGEDTVSDATSDAVDSDAIADTSDADTTSDPSDADVTPDTDTPPDADNADADDADATSDADDADDADADDADADDANSDAGDADADDADA